MSKKTSRQPDEAASTRREQLRLQQEAAAKRARTTRIIGVLAGVLAVAIIALVAVLVVQQNNDKDAAAAANKAAQISAPNLNADKTGILINPADADAAKVPTLVVYQDYQCPICKQYEEFYGTPLRALATSGKLIIDNRTMTFMDTNLKNTASTRAAVGATCADVSGKYEAYHDAVFANQSTEEVVGSEGYSDQLLRVDIPTEIGITGADLTSFQACYDQQATLDLVNSIYEAAGRAGVNSTPTYKVADKVFDLSKFAANTDELLAGLRSAAGMTP